MLGLRKRRGSGSWRKITHECCIGGVHSWTKRRIHVLKGPETRRMSSGRGLSMRGSPLCCRRTGHPSSAGLQARCLASAWVLCPGAYVLEMVCSAWQLVLLHVRGGGLNHRRSRNETATRSITFSRRGSHSR